MSSRIFFKTPLGAESHTIPIAQTAKTETSKDLIPNTDKDAFFFRSLEKQGIYLNEPQIHAVRHFKGPLLALAGAGSGKTSVLVCRTGYLIAVRNINPKNILLVMFSKKAAEECVTESHIYLGWMKILRQPFKPARFTLFCLKSFENMV